MVFTKKTANKSPVKSNQLENLPAVSSVIYTNNTDLSDHPAVLCLQDHLRRLYKRKTQCDNKSNVALVALPLATDLGSSITMVKINNDVLLIGNKKTSDNLASLVQKISEASVRSSGYYATVVPDNQGGWLVIDQGHLQNDVWRRSGAGAKPLVDCPAAPVINHKVPCNITEITEILTANQALFGGFLLIATKSAIGSLDETAQIFLL
jgi:hypothetical protein